MQPGGDSRRAGVGGHTYLTGGKGTIREDRGSA